MSKKYEGLDVIYTANFESDRFVIISDATQQEKQNEIKQKYGSFLGNPKRLNTPNLINRNK